MDKVNRASQKTLYRFKQLIKMQRYKLLSTAASSPDPKLARLRDNFLESCTDMSGDQTLYTLFKLLDGSSVQLGGCDLLQIIYETGKIDPTNPVAIRGDVRSLASISSYIVSVINVGILVQFGFLQEMASTEKGLNKEVLLRLYDSRYKTSLQRIQDFYSKAQWANEGQKNALVNYEKITRSGRVMQLDNQAAADAIVEKMTMIHPGHGWQAFIVDRVDMPTFKDEQIDSFRFY
jgi:hypothetical protein